jgi:hypothetical protein
MYLKPLACFAGKSVLVIDGKNKMWSRRKRNIGRRSKQQAEITTQKGKRNIEATGD